MTTMTHATPALAEADRLMTICNSCRYCEGLCAVFPAMEERRAFGDGDLNYLANLCHGCGACYVDCQFTDPHDFNVNVPRVLGEVRAESYAAYAWPPQLRPLFERNGLAVALIASLSVAAFILGFVGIHDRSVLFGSHSGPGAFYQLMPHNTMAALFGAVFVYAIAALTMGVAAFWRDITRADQNNPHKPKLAASPGDWPALWQAIKDAASLRYLDGGGAGCYTGDDQPKDNRRLYHHLTSYGFLLCFAATSVATLYHYLLGRIAPYPWWDLPVVLGTVGGIGLLIGPAGLLASSRRSFAKLRARSEQDMGQAFLVMLFLTSLTGLALLVLRATPALGGLLALHLGVVLGLFLTMPYGKFVHGIYRFAALVRSAQERRAADATP